ncbi:Glycosyl hydrolases family 28 [Musa troglodytarum]|uniref:Glycosyl hydrolases family 28 n=1 Tax=Musa troglodytarum TaxID=320322 RepID=A0A9E7IF87_9LILI|nr:Glycosyl hydrolases family 28 [Musa troglodytarum]
MPPPVMLHPPPPKPTKAPVLLLVETLVQALRGGCPALADDDTVERIAGALFRFEIPLLVCKGIRQEKVGFIDKTMGMDDAAVFFVGSAYDGLVLGCCFTRWSFVLLLMHCIIHGRICRAFYGHTRIVRSPGASVSLHHRKASVPKQAQRFGTHCSCTRPGYLPCVSGHPWDPLSGFRPVPPRRVRATFLLKRSLTTVGYGQTPPPLAGTYASATADMLRPRLERGSPTSYWLGVVRAPHLNPVRDGGKKPQWQFCYTTTGQDRRRRNMVGRSSNGGGGLWRLADEMNPPEVGCRAMEAECVRRFHRHEPKENQCSSSVVKHIKAPVHLVWSLVRRFDQPQRYKPFVSRCIMQGDFAVGCLREVNIKSGLPATTSTERLEQLDDNEHILSIKIVGGDHRLQNYSSVVTAHPEIIDGRPGTLVIESFVVDVPEGNTKDDTCFFVEALIKCNLKSLAILVCKKLILDCSASKILCLLKALTFGLHTNSILTKKPISTGSRGLLKLMVPSRALVGVAALLPLLLQCSVAVTEVSCSDIVPMKSRREVISITDFGAVGDGRTLNTWPFKKAIYRIQHLRSRGGTLLYIPPGVWLTGSFSLTSHMTLYLARGAVIKATQDTWNWPLVDPLPSYGRGRELPGRRYVSFIQGDGISDVIITAGENGTIDGQGDVWWNMWRQRSLHFTRPNLLEFKNSRDVIISNVVFQNSPFWNIHPVYCRLQLKCLHRGCSYATGDDLVAIKSGWDEYGIAYGRPSSGITIRRLQGSSPFSGIAIGSETSGGVENVLVENINLYNTGFGIHIKTNAGRGGYIRNVTVVNVSMNKVRKGIRIAGDVGDHPDEYFNRYAMPTVDGVTIKNVWGVDIQQPGSIEGIRSSPFTRICLSNVKLWGALMHYEPWKCMDVSGAALGVQPWPCSQLTGTFSAGFCSSAF